MAVPSDSALAAEPVHWHTLLRNDGLSLTLSALFVAFLVGQTFAGLREYNDDRAEHGQRGSPESKPVDALHLETE
jgi:hypothetical protein